MQITCLFEQFLQRKSYSWSQKMISKCDLKHDSKTWFLLKIRFRWKITKPRIQLLKNFVWQNEETTLKMFSNRKHMHNKVDLNYPHSFLRLLNIQWRHFELPYVHCYLFWCLEIQYARFKHERMFLQSTLSYEISECFSLHFFLFTRFLRQNRCMYVYIIHSS